MSGAGADRLGGIDLGGSKIEARLFDAALAPLGVQRVATPTDSFEALVAALVGQLDWLRGQGAGRLAVSIAGVIDPETGIATASNIPISGHDLGAAVAAGFGRRVPMLNDCQAFAASEAAGGAGTGAASVLGLILGTGVGAGYVAAGRALPRHAGLAVEIGHLGLPARDLARHGLAPLRCGCGRIACNETYIAGPGLTRLAEARGLGPLSPAGIAARGDAAAEAVLDLWADLTGEMLYTAQLMLDPEVIVLGGGLSNMPGVTGRLSAALARKRLGQARAPRIVTARHGDSSGARGAAIVAAEVDHG